MPYFHGTHLRRIDDILTHGLGGRVTDRNFPESEEGVYLASDPVICIGVLIDHYLTAGQPGSSPKDQLASFRIIVIDDARVDPAKLRPDPSFEGREGVFVYGGVIDVNAMPILSAEDVLPKQE